MENTREDVKKNSSLLIAKSYQIGKTYLFFIGVDKYKPGLSSLNNAVKDAQDVSECLLEKYQLDRENLTLLVNEQVTRKSIIEKFSEYEKLITDEDNLIFYFSGHGTDYATFNTGYWLTSEAESGDRSTYLSNDEVIQFVKSLKAKHVFGIVDACFSSALLNYRNTNPLLSRLYNRKSRWLLTSGGLEPVSDGYKGKNSPFAERLLDYLKDHGKPTLWIGELCINVRNSMNSSSEKQLPIGQAVPDLGDRGGGFALIKRGHEVSNFLNETESKDETPQKSSKNILEIVPTSLSHLAGKNLNELKDSLSDLITDDEWQSVFDQLKQGLVRGQKRETLILLIGNYNRNKKAQLTGIESIKKSNIKLNIFQYNLLYFINNLRIKDLKYKNEDL